MAEGSSGNRISSVLPGDVGNLIARTLRLHWQKQVQRFSTATQLAYSKLNKEVAAVIGTSKTAQAFTTIPLAAFDEIVAGVAAITRSWPGIVWESITSIADKAQLRSWNSDELNDLMDECAWGKDQTIFMQSATEPDQYKEVFVRILGGYGVKKTQLDRYSLELDRELASAAELAACNILNTARRAREEIGIDIDQYLIEQRLSKANQVDTGIGDSSGPPCEVSPPSSTVTTTYRQSEVFLKMKNLTSDELSISFVGDKAESGLAFNNMLEISARK